MGYALSSRMALEDVARAAQSVLDAYHGGDPVQLGVELAKLKLAVEEAKR